MAEIKSTNKYLIKRKYKTINGTTYPMDEYQVILYKVDSEDCGYIRPQYQWSATTGYICDFETYTKYSREVKMVSYDSGTTWSVAQPVEERRGEVIAYDSYDCGKPMYRCIETDETYCEDNGDDFAASFYRNNEVVPRVTIECSDSVIYEQDKDYFDTTDWYSKLAASSITQVNIGDCVTEFRKFYWSFSSATLTIGNNVRLVWDRAIGGEKFTKHLNFKNPIVLPPSVKKIEEHELNGVTCYIKPLANPSVDEFAIRRVDEYTISPVVKGNYNIVAPYGTKYNWEQLKLIEQISGGTVVQEDYQTPNEDWKVKITFEDNSVNYLADDPTHVLGANEIDRMSNILVDSSSDRHWYRQNNQVLVGARNNYYAIKEIEISSTVSAVTENAIKNFYSYICNFKLNEGLLVFGDMFNNQVSPYMGNEYHNYTVTMPSTLTAITSSRICASKVTFRHVTYGYTLIFTSTIPPTLAYPRSLENALKIVVPCGSLNRYLTEWSQYADKIEPFSYECLHDEWKDEGSFACVDDKLCTVERLYKCLNSDVCYPTEETRTIETSGSCNGYDIIDKMVVLTGNNETYSLFNSDIERAFDDYRIQFGFNGFENLKSSGLDLMKNLSGSGYQVYVSIESQSQNYGAYLHFVLNSIGSKLWNYNNTDFEIGAAYIQNLNDGTINGEKDNNSYTHKAVDYVAYIRRAPWKWIKVYKKVNGEWKLQKYLLPCVNNNTSVYSFFDVAEFVDDKYSE